jgi:hypothetical protein
VNDLLSWTLVIGATLACIALAFNALQVVTSVDEFGIARFWFVVAAIILLGRFVIWGATTNRSLTLRLVVSVIACGLIAGFTIEGVRYVNRKKAPRSQSI